MVEFFVFLYGMATAFVIASAERNRRERQPNPGMVVAIGWGLFSLSVTLAVLMGALALAVMLGAPIEHFAL